MDMIASRTGHCTCPLFFAQKLTKEGCDPVETLEVLQVSDIQRILGIGRRQAYELVNSGQFHVIRIGKSIRVLNTVFYNWMNGTTRTTKGGDEDGHSAHSQ
jgi:hypothetical protein